jgi:hypothetical protein
MPWKPGLTPEAPQEVSISTVSGEPTLSWNAVGGNGISYIVYRSAETAFNTSDVFAIVSVTGRAVTSISLRGVEPGSVLAVAAVDRLGAESRLSSPVRYTGPTASR